jgi:hypothetical protein
MLDKLTSYAEISMREVQNLKDSMILLDDSVSNTVNSKINKYHQEKDRIFKALANDPHTMNSGNSLALKNAIDTKADKSHIVKLQETIIQRPEINKVVDKLSLVQTEVTNILVLLNESVKLNLFNSADTMNAK